MEAVSLVANLFLGGEAFDRALQEAITLFGLATEVDTVRLFRLNSDSEDTDTHHSIKNIASWTRITIQTDEREQYIKTNNIPVEKGLLSRLVRGETLILNASEIQMSNPLKREIQLQIPRRFSGLW